jgi:hypothetical protein
LNRSTRKIKSAKNDKCKFTNRAKIIFHKDVEGEGGKTQTSWWNPGRERPEMTVSNASLLEVSE